MEASKELSTKKKARVPCREKLKKAGPVALSAALLTLAFPPFNLPLLVFVAFIPWFVTLSKTTGKGAWNSGYLFGLLFGISQLYWIGALTWRWTGNIPMGVLPWFLACLAYALYFGLVATLIRKCWTRNWPWLIPVVWAGVEVFRSFIPWFAFPWGLTAAPLIDYVAIIQSAHYGLIFLVSAWVIAANVMVAQLLIARSEGDPNPAKKLRPLGIAFTFVLLLSFYRYSQPETGKPFVVTVGQPGVDLAFGKKEDEAKNLRRAIQPILDEAEKDGTQLVLLPEGIADARHMPPVTPFGMDRVPVLFGARRGTSPTFQSAFGYDVGKWRYSDKTRLVIFGEFVPLRQQLPWLASAFNLPSGDMQPGLDGVRAMKLAGITVGPVVCFEGIFSDIGYKQALNGAQMLGVISVDDWYLGTGAPEQLRALSIWRAVETGLPLARSATQGYSLVTDSKGRVVSQAPLKEARKIRREMILPDKSPMSPFSAAFPALSFVVGLVLLFTPNKRQPVQTESSEVA